jgi:C-terminal processing protease CtpA/Prc
MTLITASGTKESVESKVGIAFTRKNDDAPLTIKIVREGGLFFDSDLRPGMVVTSINGVEMTWKTPKEAADELRASAAGDVSVTCEAFVGKIVKDDKDEKMGISLKNSTARPGIFISKLAEGSKLAGTELKVGQQVIYINKEPCPAITKEAIKLIKEATTKVSIVTIDPDMENPNKSEPAPVAAVSAPESPAPVVEEKKDEEPAQDEAPEAAEGDEPKDADKSAPLEEGETAEDKDAEDAEKKGLLDTVFSACIC